MNKRTVVILSIIVLAIAVGFGGYKYIQYTKSPEYKLKKKGYPEDEINLIIKKVDSSKVDLIIDMEYNDKIALIVNEKYYLKEKLDDYIGYQSKNSKLSIADVISVVNAGAHKNFYTNILKTDTSKENLMIVNKFYGLDKDFKFDDIVSFARQYAHEGQSARKEVHDKFIEMYRSANKLDLNLIVSSSYRSYERQEVLYKQWANIYGEEQGDALSARPGHSEHQTGLTLDIAAHGSSIDDFGETEEFEWVKDNAHKYGFIIRYPKDKAHITGYDYEPWHYRYVGGEVATKIYDLQITFDEYYELYIK